jgi:hypothetical protein
MNTYERILVIILATVLTLFLTLSIMALVKIIQILDRIKHISEKAEDFAEKAEAVGEFFQKTAGPAAVAKGLARMLHTFNKGKK